MNASFADLLPILAYLIIQATSTGATLQQPHAPQSPQQTIDSLVQSSLKNRGITPARLCSDGIFIRRVYLDLLGTLPSAQEARSFISDKRPDKRQTLINTLLNRDEYADYWTLKWCDILRVKAEFPINLWPNAVQAYHKWIHDCLKSNKPYNEFVRELLTSSGSNFRVPPVNFYRAVQGKDAAVLAHAAALTFMGCRLETWPKQERQALEAFFSRVAFKSTAEWKEEIVYLDPSQSAPLEAKLPDGTRVTIASGQDPRLTFASWLISPANPWFVRNIVNRQWSWLFGRGIIHEADDIRPENLPVHPQLLTLLEKEFVSSGYNLKHTFRLILNSHTYQQSAIPASNHPDAERLFAHYPVRRLEAEVLIDALDTVYGGPRESYSSPIPEPFTFIPEEHRAINLADGSITSQFLEMFGRPARDTGLESERSNAPSSAQRLHFLNSSHIQNKIAKSPKLNYIKRIARRDSRKTISMLYLSVLSRHPTTKEIAVAENYLKNSQTDPRQWAIDLAWALTNSKEFHYRH